MRKVVFNHLDTISVPFPYYNDNGGVQSDLLSYLLCRYYYRSNLNLNPNRKLREVTKTTIKNIAHHVAFLLNIFEENTDENGNLAPIDYRQATFEDVSQIISDLYHEFEWQGNSLKVYAASWRQFYEFLTIENVDHNMVFPDRDVVNRQVNADDHFLSHTSHYSPTETVQLETAVPEEFCIQETEDYRDSVISMEQWFEVFVHLYEEDPVYATMAATMMQTFLRIGGIMQFPIGVTSRNQQWKRYAEMKRHGKPFQYLHYINKGQKPAKCMVHIATMALIHGSYLDTVYDERQERYLTDYVHTKFAKKQHRDERNKFTWLNKHGTPVSPRELQSAFERVSERLGFKIHPHMLRHTGATQLLYAWGKAKEIKITEANAVDIHSWLRHQLGHKNISTTLYYVRTIQRLEAENVIAEILPAALPVSLENSGISTEIRDAYQRAMTSQNEFMHGSAA